MDRPVYIDHDQLLIQKIRKGNREAFDDLYKKYWKQVYNAAYKRLGNHEQAKDISQEVFTQLWMQLNRSDYTTEIQNFPAFLYTIVRNNVFKLMEKEKKYVPVSEMLSELEGLKMEHSDAQLLFRELQDSFEKLLSTLSAQQQQVFKLRYLEGLSSNEISDLLQVSPKTVRNQLGRALKKLGPSSLLLILIYRILFQ